MRDFPETNDEAVEQLRRSASEDYRDLVIASYCFPRQREPLECSLVGLAGEVGEIMNVVMKLMRGDFDVSELRPGGKRHEWLVGELGGVLWFWTAACLAAGTSPEEVMAKNAKVIDDRLQRGVIKGDGDKR